MEQGPSQLLVGTWVNLPAIPAFSTVITPMCNVGKCLLSKEPIV